MKIKSIAIAASAAAVFSPMAALAGTYEALCGDIKCTVNVSSVGIRSPQGSIPASRVSYWSVNGESSTSVGTGLATTILLGGIGLLGFLAKNHNYDFTVDGYDSEGRKVAMQFKFKNNKPAKQLSEELYRVLGLAMGRQRTIAEIKAIESGESPLNAMASRVEPSLASTSRFEPSLASATKSSNCGRVLMDYGCNYSTYLDANPSVKAWAEANPEMAAKERIRLGAYTDEEIEEREKAKASTKVNSIGRLDSGLGTIEGYVPESAANTETAIETPFSQPAKSRQKRKPPVNCNGTNGGGIRCRDFD